MLYKPTVSCFSLTFDRNYAKISVKSKHSDARRTKGSELMIIRNIGFNHCHGTDFIVDRPHGSGDYLLLLLKTDTIFVIDNQEVFAPKNSFFLFSKDVPQLYRCVPNCTFSNDWIHFDIESGEQSWLDNFHIPFCTPIPMKDLLFLSFCVKAISNEFYSDNRNKERSIACYMTLIFSKVEEQLFDNVQTVGSTSFEMLSSIRNKIYSKPYEQRTIAGTAHEVLMSESAFQHLYKKQFGISFMQDLIESRIEYAKLLLSTTDVNVAEIAKQCGYSSYGHFMRQFKKRTNLTPTEYRLQKKP